MGVSQADLVKYYYQYKDLILLHQKLEFGKAPRSSEGFTETLCCNLFNLKRATDVKRKYDLIDPATDAKIEVKATIETYGSTTINPTSVFDHLYWVTFLLIPDSFTIRKIDYAELTEFFKSRRHQKRSNITLSNFKSSEPSIFFFCKETQKIIPQTLTDQLEHIKRYVKKAG